MIKHELTGRVALITGSTTGIGRAIAEALGAKGAALVAHGIEAEQRAKAVADWRKRGWQVIASDVDLTRPYAGAELAESAAAALGSIDILVLNASIETPQRLAEVTAGAVAAQIAVNLTANLELLQACLPGMRASAWGRVIAMGSVQEERPNARHLVYAATKSALTSMILNLARHEASPGLTMNVLRPGAILTDRNRACLSDADYEKAVLGRIPLARIGTPQDCAGMASLLCTDAGGYVHGAVIPVDGGMRL